MDREINERRMPRRAMALVLAGGRGSRLQHLTEIRCKPAVYFGGKFRIIDFVLSNCMNSGMRRIGILTQYKSHSLLRHMQRGWAFLKSEMNEFIDFLPAQQRLNDESWYRGTADAVLQNLDIVRANMPDYVVILAGDHIYKMDYARMLSDHIESRASVTVGCIEVPRADAREFGVMAINTERRITEFLEKPADPPCVPGKPDVSLASMGIYIFNATYLYNILALDANDPDSTHDFGRDIIPRAVREAEASAHPFSMSCINSNDRGHYWRDVGTVDAYWEANLDLTATNPDLNMYDTTWPIWTHQQQLPPAKFVHNQPDRRGMAVESLISGGCIISGSLERSLLFSNCRVHSYSKVAWSVLLPEVEVGRHARLNRCIIDHGVKIPDGFVVGEDPVEDARRFYVSEGGITLITRSMIERL